MNRAFERRKGRKLRRNEDREQFGPASDRWTSSDRWQLRDERMWNQQAATAEFPTIAGLVGVARQQHEPSDRQAFSDCWSSGGLVIYFLIEFGFEHTHTYTHALTHICKLLERICTSFLSSFLVQQACLLALLFWD